MKVVTYFNIMCAKTDKRRDKSFDSERKKTSEMADLWNIYMDIAMCHFVLTARELDLKGIWEESKHVLSTLPKYTEYIVSWNAEVLL
ncbi:MAG: hypothetical protein JW755_09100 [Candidatus Aminicenantes bacterium]|nr:hypothetical protein [Candidatus Aminicenantes bacterium]